MLSVICIYRENFILIVEVFNLVIYPMFVSVFHAQKSNNKYIIQ